MNFNKLDKQLLLSISSISDTKVLKQFLYDILTEKEYKEIVIRLEILLQLAQGKSQREIAKELGVGIATVTRGARVLEKPGSIINDLLKNKE
jgi:TrpR family transcriptional regulator, trp operon repressor